VGFVDGVEGSHCPYFADIKEGFVGKPECEGVGYYMCRECVEFKGRVY
jgi:hypothetical protein